MKNFANSLIVLLVFCSTSFGQSSTASVLSKSETLLLQKALAADKNVADKQATLSAAVEFAEQKEAEKEAAEKKVEAIKKAKNDLEKASEVYLTASKKWWTAWKQLSALDRAEEAGSTVDSDEIGESETKERTLLPKKIRLEDELKELILEIKTKFDLNRLGENPKPKEVEHHLSAAKDAAEKAAEAAKKAASDAEKATTDAEEAVVDAEENFIAAAERLLPYDERELASKELAALRQIAAHAGGLRKVLADLKKRPKKPKKVAARSCEE